MNQQFDVFKPFVLTWAVWKFFFTLGPKVSHEALVKGQFGHPHAFMNFKHHFLIASIDEVCYANDARKKNEKKPSCLLAARIWLKMVHGFTPCAGSFGKSDGIPLSVPLPSHFGPHRSIRKWCSLGSFFMLDTVCSKNSNLEDNDFPW